MSVAAASSFDFETARLRLRRLQEVDSELFCALHSDAETMRFIRPALSREQALKSFRQALALSQQDPVREVFLVLIERDFSEAIGVCSLQHLDLQKRTIEAGMMLKAQARSRRYAHEGLDALVARAFQSFPVDEVRVQTSENHAIAHRLVVGVGFKRCDGGRAAGLHPAMQAWRIRRAAKRLHT
jgi:RimJ/RimL family protein N-acetyltransferase